MASKYRNPPQTELIAIYRLEFYKKQRNWKFCKDVCKDLEPTESEPEPRLVPEKSPEPQYRTPSLNETYCITKAEDEAYCEDNDSALNDAFVDNDSDKNPPVTPPDPDMAPTWPETDTAEPQAAEPWSCWPDAEEQVQESPDLCDGVWERAEHAWQNVEQGAIGGEEAFLMDTEQLQDLSGMWEYNRACPALCSEPGFPADLPWKPVTLDEEKLRAELDSTEWLLSMSLGSVTPSEFARGAAAAPHSSEINLYQRSGLSQAEASAGRPVRGYKQRTIASLSLDHRLDDDLSFDDPPTRDRDPPSRPSRPHPFASQRDLTDAFLVGSAPPGVIGHPIAYPKPYFAPKLIEYRGKAGLKSGSLTTVGSYDPDLMRSYDGPKVFNKRSFDPCAERCVPTMESFRDSSRFCRGTPVVERGDPFVAGSFRNVAEGGRGRGRLKKDRVIGIGMGRPYRL